MSIPPKIVRPHRPKKKHEPITGYVNQPRILAEKVGSILHGTKPPSPPPRPLTDGAKEALRHMELAKQQFEESQLKNQPEEKIMTVSLYISTASGKQEIVVQTNAQSLDLYITGLADAMDAAIGQMDASGRGALLASLLRNALPVAFSIAGYKAERVSESRMLVCGAAAPGESNLLAHSRT